MPDLPARRSAVIVATLAASVLIASALPSAAAAKEPSGLSTFMRAIGQVESGGRYRAVNHTSGAYGKYQILPSMWRAWARIYFGNANMRPTPVNQERLAKAVMTRAYRKFGSWPVVAHYWLTGRGERDRSTWSSVARRYVAKVMKAYTAFGGVSARPVTTSKHSTKATRTISETSAAIRYAGGWSSAAHSAYAGGHVEWASRAGARATFTFTGTQVSLIGPEGPTRGQARILIDGSPVALIDTYARRFDATERLFTATFAARGTHTLTVEVLGTRGRPVVAIDAFTVRR